MDLEFRINPESGDIRDGASGVDVQLVNRETGEQLSSVLGASLEISVDDITMDAVMIVMLTGLNFQVNGKFNGIPTLVTFEDEPHKVEEVYVQLKCISFSTEKHKPPKKMKDGQCYYSRSYITPCATTTKIIDVETGQQIINFKSWKFGASVDDISVKAEAVCTGSRILTKKIDHKYGIGSNMPIEEEH